MAPRKPMDSLHRSPDSEHPNILVIDDDPNGIRLLVRLLSLAGYEPEPALGAEDALRKLSRRHYDLVLVELAMKQVSGIRLIEIIRSSAGAYDTPIVAVTAPIRRSLLRPLGCDGLLFRPVEPGELVRTIEAARSRGRGSQAARKRTLHAQP